MWPPNARANELGVVSESAAMKLFGTADVAGRTILRWRGEASEELRIVGVAADTYDDDERERNVIYVPLDASMDRSPILGTLVIARTGGEPEALLPALRQAVAGIDPGLAIDTSGTGRALAGGSTAEFYRITASLAGTLGTCAWVLALAGLYGVLSQLVQRRRREIGLRMALGAERRDVIRMVLRDGLRPVITGIAVGLLLAIVAGLLLPAQFARLVPTIDPAAVAIVPPLFGAFAGAALLACYLPARRASRVDPNVALKDL
jgi:putative ABC transport system permease protein